MILKFRATKATNEGRAEGVWVGNVKTKYEKKVWDVVITRRAGHDPSRIHVTRDHFASHARSLFPPVLFYSN